MAGMAGGPHGRCRHHSLPGLPYPCLHVSLWPHVFPHPGPPGRTGGVCCPHSGGRECYGCRESLCDSHGSQHPQQGPGVPALLHPLPRPGEVGARAGAILESAWATPGSSSPRLPFVEEREDRVGGDGWCAAGKEASTGKNRGGQKVQQILLEGVSLWRATCRPLHKHPQNMQTHPSAGQFHKQAIMSAPFFIQGNSVSLPLLSLVVSAQ